MKIKDLIKHLETLDQEKQLVVVATDPTGWSYVEIVSDETISLSEVYPCDDNGMENVLIRTEEEEDDDEAVKCYVISMSC
jgi:hypothetical protein